MLVDVQRHDLYDLITNNVRPLVVSQCITELVSVYLCILFIEGYRRLHSFKFFVTNFIYPALEPSWLFHDFIMKMFLRIS